jgi:quinol-cytochrome oxidoreductase complex cytochrome b subunit
VDGGGANAYRAVQLVAAAVAYENAVLYLHAHLAAAMQVLLGGWLSSCG